MIGGKMRMVGWICEIWCITKYLRNLNFTRGKLTILWCKFALISPKLHHPGFSQTDLLRLSSWKSFEQPQNMDVAIFPSCQSSFSILIMMRCFYHRRGSPSIVSVDLVNISFQLLIASDIWEWFLFLLEPKLKSEDGSVDWRLVILSIAILSDTIIVIGKYIFQKLGN